MTERRTPKPREVYQHYKGGQYQIVAISKFEPTEELMVTYEPLYETKGEIKNWTRTLENFLELVESTLPNGAVVNRDRFKLLG